MLIQCAMNGGRSRTENPAVPITPQELAPSAKGAVAAGAGTLHFHVRSPNGRESVSPDDVAAAVSAVRRAVPSTPFGVSTGSWIVPDPALRHQLVSEWRVLPNYASAIFKEEGSVELAKMLLSRGVGIEVGLFDAEGAEILARSGLAPKCLRVLIEPREPTTAAALETVRAIEDALDRGGVKLPRLLHGLDATCWALIDAAIARGYDTRVGFEDIVTLPDGSPAPSNAALVAEASRRRASRHLASPAPNNLGS